MVKNLQLIAIDQGGRLETKNNERKWEETVTTDFDFNAGVALPTGGILRAGALLTGLAADAAFAYLGVRASLVGASRSRQQAPPSAVAARRS